MRRLASRRCRARCRTIRSLDGFRSVGQGSASAEHHVRCGRDADQRHSGDGALSPLAGEIVDVEAIVTGDFQGSAGLSGFYIEEPVGERDTNPATSEGLFIFSSAPVDAGDRVRIRGAVAEFASATGCDSRLTELSGVSSVQVCSENQALPERST